MMTQGKIDHYVDILKQDIRALNKEIKHCRKSYKSDYDIEHLKKIRLHKEDLLTSLTKGETHE